MLEPEVTATLAQLGAAGLIGWLWLAERRSAAARETQLRELHDRILQERPQIAALLAVVRDNTRALTALEAGQRAIAAVVERVSGKIPAATPPSEPRV
jgi:hypothetical protein